MKIHKKTWIGLLVSLLGIVSFLSLGSKQVSAASPQDFLDAQYVVTAFGDKRPDFSDSRAPKTVEATIAGQKFIFEDRDTTDDIYNFKATKITSNSIICTDSDDSVKDVSDRGGITISYVPQTLPGGGYYFSGYIALIYTSGGPGDCFNSPTSQKILHEFISVIYNVPGVGPIMPDVPTPVITPTPPTPTPPPAGITDEEACYAHKWSLNWVVCPLITAAQTSANKLYGFVEKQLQFRVEEGNKNDSLGGQETREDVKAAWNNFRILVSGLVVILMLVMVIGQAIGSGPFDAYTVRKMLPRLVAGVILIQLSWPIFSWVINTVDDLGRGLADIIYAPFGGSKAMTFDKIMLAFGTEEIVWNWIGIGALGVFTAVAPFVVLGLVLTVLVAIAAGFLALLFRQILIILALIVVPLALIAWMMPNEGLRKYWKLWWDNFIKALMMFPLIVLMIAAGRIFAKIGSGQTDFVGFFIVLIGFFGPLFILPKTFKWGGQAMAFAGEKMQKAQERTLKKPKEFLGERQKGLFEERKSRSQERTRTGNALRWRRPSTWFRPNLYLDKFRSGQWDPTLGFPGSNIRGRKFAQYRQGGAKFEEENIAAEYVSLKDETERIDPNDKDDYVRAAAADRSNRNRRLAALQLLADLAGNGNHLAIQREFELIYDEQGHIRPGQHDASVDFQRFLASKQQTLFAKMPHLYKTFSAASLYTSSPEAIASMTGVEVHSILARLTQRIQAGDATAQGQLDTFLSNFNSAIGNENIRGRVDQSAIEAVHGFVNNAPTPQFNAINTERGTVHLEEIVHPSAAGAGVVIPATAGDILAQTNANGTLQPIVAPAPAPAPAPAAPAAGGGTANAREQWFRNAGDFQMANLATQVGGYDQLDQQDLQHIYNYGTGTVKEAAETELRNRGLIP